MSNLEPGKWIHYSELKPFPKPGPLSEAWDTYRREVAQMIADGHEGKYVLIHGRDILGYFDSNEEALSEGYRRFLVKKEAFLVHQVQTYEKLLVLRAA